MTTPQQRMLKLIDFNHLFAQSDNTVVLNTFDFAAPEYEETLEQHLFSRSSDIDFVAKCKCEALRGNYFLNMSNAAEPVICPKCHTPATMDMEAADGHLSHKTWIMCPPEIEGGWLNPAVYQILYRHLRYGKGSKQNFTTKTGEIANKNRARKGNYVDDILDITTPVLPEIAGAIPGKGFSYFYRNFDMIMDYFLFHHKSTMTKKGRDVLVYFLSQNRDKLFCRYLPVLSSSLHSVVMSEGTNTNRRVYSDRNSQYVLLAASALSYLRFSPHLNRPDIIESKTFQAYQEMIAYTTDISIKQLNGKQSLPRHHIFGSRLHFTFRGVITSIVGEHQLDEIHLPWSMAVNLLRLHIVGRLMQQGWSSGDAMRFHQSSIKRYNPEIDQMMQAFITESPYKGLPVLFNRNPSIRAGSIQMMFSQKIKTRVQDETIGFSCMSVQYPNADERRAA